MKMAPKITVNGAELCSTREARPAGIPMAIAQYNKTNSIVPKGLNCVNEQVAQCDLGARHEDQRRHGQDEPAQRQEQERRVVLKRGVNCDEVDTPHHGDEGGNKLVAELGHLVSMRRASP